MQEQSSGNSFVLDLQLFADGGDGADGADGGTDGADGGADSTDGGKDTKDGTKGSNAGKSETEREAEVQKRINDAVEKALKKAEKEYQKKAEAEKKKAEELSRLSEEERRKAELEAKEQELATKEKDYQRNVLKLEMVKVLTERNVPVEFMDYFIAEDSEATLKRITDFEKQFKKAVQAAVDEKLKKTEPPAGNSGKNGGSEDGVPDAGTKNGFLDIIHKNQSKR